MEENYIYDEEGQIMKQGTPAEVFTHKEVSGKFQFVGEVVSMEKQDFIFIVSILIGNELVKVIANESEVESLEPGDKVLVASKAFNPIMTRSPLLSQDGQRISPEGISQATLNIQILEKGFWRICLGCQIRIA